MNIDTAQEILLELAKAMIEDFWADFSEEAKEECGCSSNCKNRIARATSQTVGGTVANSTRMDRIEVT